MFPTKSDRLTAVMPALVARIYVFLARPQLKRDRGKPGQDVGQLAVNWKFNW